MTGDALSVVVAQRGQDMVRHAGETDARLRKNIPYRHGMVAMVDRAHADACGCLADDFGGHTTPYASPVPMW